MNTNNWTYNSESRGVVPVNEMHHNHLVNAHKKAVRKLQEAGTTPTEMGNLVALSVEVSRRNIKINPEA